MDKRKETTMNEANTAISLFEKVVSVGRTLRAAYREYREDHRPNPRYLLEDYRALADVERDHKKLLNRLISAYARHDGMYRELPAISSRSARTHIYILWMKPSAD